MTPEQIKNDLIAIPESVLSLPIYVLSQNDIKEVCKLQPVLTPILELVNLSFHTKIELIKHDIMYCNIIDLKSIHTYFVGGIIIKHPTLFDMLNTSKLSEQDMIEIIETHPDLCIKIDISKSNCYNAYTIMSKHPEYQKLFNTRQQPESLRAKLNLPKLIS